MKNITAAIPSLLLSYYTVVCQDIFLIRNYFPIADQYEWHYNAPVGLEDGDYVFKIEEISDGFSSLFKEIDDEDGKHLLVLTENTKTFMHFDATMASKLLSINKNGISFHGETFSSDGSIAVLKNRYSCPILKKEYRQNPLMSIMMQRM